MDNTLFGTHTSQVVNFYIIFDTNWLMNANGMYTIFPKVPVFSKPSWFSFSEPGMESYILLPAAVIVPTQVKNEIAKLHNDKADHKKTSNAKRNYSKLQRQFGKKVKPYLRVPRYETELNFRDWNEEFNEANPEFEQALLAFHEVNLEAVPIKKMFEDIIGPDSDVDKGIVSLARAICEMDSMNHCFIATHDTGIQAEVSHLFYRYKMNIGCPSFMDEWIEHQNHWASIMVEQGGGVNAYR
jgi:hypothetical protein